MAYILALLPAAGHDQIWFLLMARRLLDGAKLYGPEVFDSNPPLIVWLSAIPCTLARWLHLPATAIGKALVAALEAAVWVACLRMTRALVHGLSRTAVWALGFAYIVIFACVPARDFGQREHLLALLCLPYLLAAAIALTGCPLTGWRATAVGVVAGLGLALKPHQLLVPIAVESLIIWKYARIWPRHARPWHFLRPEALGLIAVCFLYLSAISIFTPQYLTQVLPILRDTYWAIGGLSLPQLFLQAIQLHMLAALAVGLYLVLQRSSTADPQLPAAAEVFLIAGFAATVAYYLQGTGWYYQQLPALSFFAIASWIELLPIVRTQGIRFSLRVPLAWPAGGLAILAIALTAYFSGYSLSRPWEFPSGLARAPDPAFFTNLAPRTPVAILTTEVDLGIPRVLTDHLVWAQRTNNLWLMPAILGSEAPAPNDPEHRIPRAHLTQLDAMQHRWMVEDLTRWHPQLILIQRCHDPAVLCQKLEGRHDNLLTWFQRDPAFRAIFAHYRYLRSSGPFDGYVPD
ncbi:MAG TPA: hypothetical protein VN678_09000 [Acidobacteriaceae bacterium]|nr:hypothetical protein [Acidobacteriaceae bacterium]